MWRDVDQKGHGKLVTKNLGQVVVISTSAARSRDEIFVMAKTDQATLRLA